MNSPSSANRSGRAGGEHTSLPVRASADDLVRLLAERHADAVFVSECKDGSSWNGARRLDAWALLKTWSPLTAIGYEVKVSRSDFLQDRKWPDYLPVCHELYFVCPAKLIGPEELPPDVGLMWTHGQRLVVKRKAPRRQPDEKALVMLMSYVLMSRSRIVGEWREANRSDGREYWRHWLAQELADQALGHEVSARIRKIVADARAARRHAEDDRKRLEHVAETLERLGLGSNCAAWQVEQRLDHGQCRQNLQRIEAFAEQLHRMVQNARAAIKAGEVTNAG